MPVIAGDVVHQHREIAERLRSIRSRGLKGSDIAHITGAPPNLCTDGGHQFFCQLAAFVFRNIHEGHMSTLLSKCRHDGGTNPSSATGNEYVFAFEAGIAREFCFV
uniref:Uncharacterized protein n=1 Tax=Curvibacter symbiont subsp. Hydra magnipapillata TaxID=667019 RepID=C9YCK0_CURXX|nr:hypothetical protein Csp_C24290 [Curvibacter putative symbiont of Hydra magnipapillata]